ncbi:hypothetical protein KJ632_01260, partial [Patescibacteria group bacterium]|nr:hypothetical protein [Patescibacteria group bacterium]
KIKNHMDIYEAPNPEGQNNTSIDSLPPNWDMPESGQKGGTLDEILQQKAGEIEKLLEKTAPKFLSEGELRDTLVLMKPNIQQGGDMLRKFDAIKNSDNYRNQLNAYLDLFEEYAKELSPDKEKTNNRIELAKKLSVILRNYFNHVEKSLAGNITKAVDIQKYSRLLQIKRQFLEYLQKKQY